MKLIETAVGLVEASRLVMNETEQELPVGKLKTTSYLLDGVVVKTDQHLELKEDAMLAASGNASM